MSLISDPVSITDEDGASSNAETCMPVCKVLMSMLTVTPTGRKLVYSIVEELFREWPVFHVESTKMHYTVGLESKLVIYMYANSSHVTSR
jgi:hypothetical protein